LCIPILLSLIGLKKAKKQAAKIREQAAKIKNDVPIKKQVVFIMQSF